jgi:hypothetical protein
VVSFQFVFYFVFILFVVVDFFFRLSFLSGKIFRESFASVEVVAENESESHTMNQTDVVDNLHYSLESASSFTEHLRSRTLDYHMTAEMLQINPTKPDFDALT